LPPGPLFLGRRSHDAALLKKLEYFTGDTSFTSMLKEGKTPIKIT
jgi:hypothetical protein